MSFSIYVHFNILIHTYIYIYIYDECDDYDEVSFIMHSNKVMKLLVSALKINNKQ